MRAADSNPDSGATVVASTSKRRTNAPSLPLDLSVISAGGDDAPEDGGRTSSSSSSAALVTASSKDGPSGAKGSSDGGFSLGTPKAARPSSLTSWALAVLGVAMTLVCVARLTFADDGVTLQATEAISSINGTSESVTSTGGGGHTSAEKVFWYAWVTAVSTSLGALPFLFVNFCKGKGAAPSPGGAAATAPLPLLPSSAEADEPAGGEGGEGSVWLARSNAIAGGMMSAASAYILYEGLVHRDASHSFEFASASLFGGVALGLLFVLASKRLLDGLEDVQFAEFGGADARRMLLIVAVMAFHSLAEGISIGVSFTSPEFGRSISLALAIHNVPEGLATCLVLVPRGVPLLEAALWATFTSLPQPLMAVPAFVVVQTFLPLLPWGLGFAAGAMAWVAVAELLAEAAEIISLRQTATLAALAATLYLLAPLVFAAHDEVGAFGAGNLAAAAPTNLPTLPP